MNLKKSRIAFGVLLMMFTMGFLVMKRRDKTEVVMAARQKLKILQPLLEGKLDDLKRKLSNVEYVSSSLSREIISLRTSVQKSHPTNKSASPLSLPNIFAFLPHLVAQPEGLIPEMHVGMKSDRRVTVAYGIPSIKRAGHSYLTGTLQSLIQGLTEEDKDEVVLIVFIGDASRSVAKSRVEDLKNTFPEAIREGLLEIIVPSSHFYPDMANLPLTFNDPPERVKWRTKQNLDYSYLMMYAQNRARFYCQLEDDIMATLSYASTVQTFALQQETNEWFMLEFSALGFIGKLFKSSDLPNMIDFFLMFYRDKPVDWLLDHILWVKVCNPEKDAKHCNLQKQRLKIRFKPSLFQHVGKVSSLKGKRQALVDKDFKNQPMFHAHLNPKAVIKTSFETYQRYTAEASYLGQTFFWALTPHTGDVLRFCFKSPIVLERFKFRTGMSDHPGDILVNATVEVLTQERKEKSDFLNKHVTEAEVINLADKENRIQNEYKREDYIEVGRFSSTGLSSNKVPDNIGPIAELRIRVLKHKNENWVAVSEIHIVEKKKKR